MRLSSLSLKEPNIGFLSCPDHGFVVVDRTAGR